MQKNVLYQDILGYSQYLCSENNSGYVHDATVPVCYKIDPTPRTRPNAILSCENFNGHLLRINTQRKQKFVEDLNLKGTDLIGKYRVDGDKTSGVWKFSDGKLISEFYWYPGEPANPGATSIGLRVAYMGKWDDIAENVQHGSICERDIEFE
ncbi:collectin-12-like [Saccostrea echinata]|uniref:collectin-12-like n=1 Tax=Saccostrea echinata TaxID=191078 RepID=UPI002A818DF7|nr:collectin-12-like [Saccostrea echinata]